METPKLYARLDKSRSRVLCAVRDCGEQIGLVLLGVDKAKTALLRVVRLPPGWAKGNDGIYRLTRHAREKFKWGRSSKLRTRPRWAREDAARWALLGEGIPLRLPAVAECPSCHRAQLLDHLRLGVESAPDLLERPIDLAELPPAPPSDLDIWNLDPQYDPRPFA